MNNYCTADKIASDPICYKWAKLNPTSMARHYFCQQQFRDPLCSPVESFADIGPSSEKAVSFNFLVFIFIVIMCMIFLILKYLRKSQCAEKYYASGI